MLRFGDWDAEGSERKDVEDIMVLVQRGTKIPELTGELSGASVVTIPSEKIASNNAATEIWIDMLNVSSQQVAVGGLKTYDDSTRYAVQTECDRTDWLLLGRLLQIWRYLLQRQPDILLSTISRIRF